ncbi:InlB B-repeat-containing protein [Adlercreutzia sp. R25]|uniref:InlB B-repeat-containing protein n=1 Tax=Adlercreutzia shanghongiae TaxID=3111773 RepID=UPI002DBD5090|nr:InlB B-repeat-containing protein [Adlercreutzia sp. R25]MEC4271957.1 InlB B-repeat-containing protein [Adlercreutzia sp. R25]
MSSTAKRSNRANRAMQISPKQKGARLRRLLTGALALVLGVGLAPIVPALAEGVGSRGPEDPAIENEFDEFSTVDFQTHQVTLRPNGGQGEPYIITTDTGTITLPDPADIGFTAPSGATFVGWSTDKSGRTNVYSQEVIFPDNANHTAALDRDADVYAIWLPSGDATSGVTAYFYLRADGTIPFEPSQGQQSAYVPRGSGTALQGMLRQPVAVTNNPDVVALNLQKSPTAEELSQVLADAKIDGLGYNPDTEKVVWYVIKSREYGGGAWNVDGVIVPKAEYLVYYNPNGGYSDVPPAQSYFEKTPVKVDFSTMPTRPGYDFLGWADSATAEKPDYPAGQWATFIMPAADKHLYAVWAPRSVDIRYQAEPADGGALTQALNTVRAYDGDGITGSSAEPAAGYLFQGWYKGQERVAENPDLDDAAIVRTANRLQGAFAATTYTARFVRATASMTASKAVLNAPSNGEYFVEGETVNYRVEVTNTGNTVLESLVVADTLSGEHTLAALTPGQSGSVEYAYTVTADDAARGFVINEAAVSAKAYDGRGGALAVPEQVVGAAVRTGALPSETTYVLYGVYPETGGTVGQNYEIVNADTAEGLTDRTAEAKPGYHFAGWYEGDALVSDKATLTADEMREALNHGDGARVTYAPTLFIAHFVADEPDGPDSPDNPDDPNVPENPDDPDTPGTPADSDQPGDEGATANPGEPDSHEKGGDDSAAGVGASATTHKTPSAYRGRGTTTARSKTVPATGDERGVAMGALAVTALIAGCVAWGARRRLGR